MVRILGILNLTRDSFSDGGRYLEADAAVRHARQMHADGADAIDVGAESTHPDAEAVSAETEIARLTPVIAPLKAAGIRVSIDTYKPAVMRHGLALGVDFINDVTALREPDAVAVVRASNAQLILMHSVADGPRAQRVRVDPTTIVDRILAFFERRLRELETAGIDRDRLILDPGMGLFLGTSTAASLAVLRALPRLATLGRPLLLSTSRKSFIGSVLGHAGDRRPVTERAAGTLATELWAAQHGVAYIRTHDVRALRDALTMWQTLSGEAPETAQATGEKQA